MKSPHMRAFREQVEDLVTDVSLNVLEEAKQQGVGIRDLPDSDLIPRRCKGVNRIMDVAA